MKHKVKRIHFVGLDARSATALLANIDWAMKHKVKRIHFVELDARSATALLGAASRQCRLGHEAQS